MCFHELYLVISYNGNDIRDYHYRLYWYNGKFVIKVGSYISKIMLHFVLNEKEVYLHVSQGFFYTFSMSKYNVSVYRCIRYDSITFYHTFFLFTRHVVLENFFDIFAIDIIFEILICLFYHKCYLLDNFQSILVFVLSVLNWYFSM